jgi:hypothetical protein
MVFFIVLVIFPFLFYDPLILGPSISFVSACAFFPLCSFWSFFLLSSMTLSPFLTSVLIGISYLL